MNKQWLGKIFKKKKKQNSYQYYEKLLKLKFQM